MAHRWSQEQSAASRQLEAAEDLEDSAALFHLAQANDRAQTNKIGGLAVQPEPQDHVGFDPAPAELLSKPTSGAVQDAAGPSHRIGEQA
jgi:hypothetical protein